MLEEILESSTQYNKRLKDLRVQALTLCVYNLLIAHFLINQKDLEWNYGLVGDVYRERIGIQDTLPTITSKFGFTHGYVHLVLSILMSFPVFIANRKLRNYLLPGLLWNIYFLTIHLINMIDICYDVFALAPGFYTTFMIVTASLFLIAIHTMLVSSTISYYDVLNMKTPQMEDATFEGIEQCFEFSKGEGDSFNCNSSPCDKMKMGLDEEKPLIDWGSSGDTDDDEN